jgi:hypothetical protein
VIIVAASLIGIVGSVVAGADLRRLASIEVRRLWLVWAAIGLQVGVLTYLGSYVHGTIGNVVHLGTYALAGVFVVVNRRVPGMVMMGTGAAMNVVAIVANGGVMPASSTAWDIAGFGAKTGFNNSVPVEDPKLLFLGDVFALPARWPLANVFSAGDVVLVVGITWMVLRVGRVPRSRIPDGYVMVPITDEHRQVLLRARMRLADLIETIERQADDARRLHTGAHGHDLLADEEWRGVIDSITGGGSGGAPSADATPIPTLTSSSLPTLPPPTLPVRARRLFADSSGAAVAEDRDR